MNDKFIYVGDISIDTEDGCFSMVDLDNVDWPTNLAEILINHFGTDEVKEQQQKSKSPESLVAAYEGPLGKFRIEITKL